MKRSLLAAVLGCGLLISGCGDDENAFFGNPFVEPFLLEFVNAPGFGQPNVVLAASEVQFQDANNQILPISNVPITVSLATNPTGATLSGTLVGDLINGSVTFNNLQLDRKGTFILRATSPGLNEALSTAITIGGGVPNFAAPTTVNLGVTMLLLDSGDFNNDGNLDIVATNFDNTQLSLLLGDGLGGFAVSVIDIVGAPTDVATGDLNGDGFLDIIVPEQNQDRLAVLLGNGNGTFDAPVFQVVGDNPQFVGLADFNGDGILDAVNSNIGSGTMTFSRGVGDGTFNPAVPFTLDSGNANSAAALGIGDFNGDGNLDVAVSDLTTDEVNLFRGNGAGNFLAPTTAATGVFPRGIGVADFNEDGIADVAVANRGVDGDAGNDSVTVLFGAVGGTFVAGPTLVAEDRPNAVRCLDVNGDGNQDIAITNSGAGSNSVLIYLGQGDGTFSAPLDIPSNGTAPTGLEVADFNNDTLLDFVVGNNNSLQVSVFLQTQ